LAPSQSIYNASAAADAENEARRDYESSVRPWNKPAISKFLTQYNHKRKSPQWEKLQPSEHRMQLEEGKGSISNKSSQNWNINSALPVREVSKSKRHSILQKLIHATARKQDPR